MNEKTHLCEGCYRTGDEIAAWRAMTPSERKQIMMQLPLRKMRGF